MARIVGLLFSGAAVRLFSISAALYVGHLGYSVLCDSLDKVQAGLALVQ